MSRTAWPLLAERLAQDPEPARPGVQFSNEIQAHGVAMVERLLALMGSELGARDVRNEATHEIPHQYLSAAKARLVP